ncbi:MAG TPA: AMP-binding protein [Acidimicrobiia bacterium]|nr:AMP-binding protein [Acidimicrobiia bacterium]
MSDLVNEIVENPPPIDLAERTRRNYLLEHSDYTVAEAITEVVRQVPDNVAIQTETEQITFAEVHARACQVANAVLDRGLDQDTPILLLCDHGTAPPTAICGVLFAGRIGAPVDVREPIERLRRMMEVSGAEWVVTDRPHLDLARVLSDKVLVLDETTGCSTAVPSVEIPERHPGLILFTSGSTGVPKGVYGAHRSMVPRSMRHRKTALSKSDRFALTSSWGFTAAEGLLFQGLVNGLTTCTYDLRTRGARGLPEWVRSAGVTHLTLMPSVLRAIVDTAPEGALSTLKNVSFGAETLYGSDVRAGRHLFGPDTVLSNPYGSTEFGSITAYRIPGDDELDDGPVPVGFPSPSVEVHVVDEDDQPVPHGEPGRILVLRRGYIALGYWRDPELTAAHFFVAPDGRSGFRTADKGRFRDDGALEHLGRLDTRVKVRGAMVATSEVEIALMSLDGVADAAVVAVDDESGGTRLIAYVAPDGVAPLSAWRLRREVAMRVPTTMVPSAFVAIDVLPRTIRHKLDRAALPPPPSPAARPYRAPSGKDAELAAIFADVLGVERVGLDDDFFDLGGDSLAAVELVAAVAEHFNVELAASALLDAPTVAELYPRLSHRRPRDASPAVALRTDADGHPFFCITGGGAPAISMRALSDAMPERNFVAIQARGLEERALPDHSVEATARRNLVVMRALQPTGPYALGGYSFGGFVAFEMACRLRAVGEDVALLVIIDTGAPLASFPSLATRTRARAAALSADAPTPRLSRSAVLAARSARFGVKSAYAHAERRVALSSAGLFPRRGYDQYELFLRLHARMAHEYRPAGTFDGPVLVLRGDASDGRPPNAPEEFDDDLDLIDVDEREFRDLGWSRLVTGPITAVDVPGDHLGLLRRPAVEKVGQVVSDALA